jgi:hypothetical protein
MSSAVEQHFAQSPLPGQPAAICNYCRVAGVDVPLYLGKGAHTLSGPAQHTAFEE